MRRIACLLLLLPLCAACSETTAAGRVTVAGTQTLSAVQVDQYRRDAKATQAAQDATVDARAYALASTASVATQTQVAVTQRAAAQATAAVITAVAVSTQAARDATRTAVADGDATATAQAAARAVATGTAQAGQQATATAAVVGTQTALGLSRQAEDVQRARVSNWLAVGLFAFAGVVVIYLVWLTGRIAARRLSVAKYGPYGNPLVVLPNGAVWNPISNVWSGDEIPPELQAKLQAGLVELLAIQAQHPPFPAVPPKPAVHKELGLGPLKVVETVSPSGVTVEKPPPPAVAAPANGRLPEPKDKMHLVFVEGANMSDDEKRLYDLRELVEGAEVRGLTRDKWQGYKFSTGRECTQGYHAELMEILKAAQVVTTKGKTYLMRVSTAQAIETLGLQGYAYR